MTVRPEPGLVSFRVNRDEIGYDTGNDHFLRNGLKRAALRLGLFFGLFLVIAMMMWPGRKTEPAMSMTRSVVAATRLHRPFLPRLAGNFIHQPFEGEPERSLLQDADSLISLEARVERELRVSSEPDLLHADALIKIVTDAGADTLKRAVLDLEAALSRNPGNPDIANDLAACLFTLAQERGRPKLMLDALAAADTALTANPNMAEALFNRALILEYLRAPGAHDAWRICIEKEQALPWREEALAHLDNLDQIVEAKKAWTSIMNAVFSAVERGNSIHDLAEGHAFHIRLEIESRLSEGVSTLSEWAVFRALAKRLAITGDSFLEESLGPLRDLSEASTLHLAFKEYANGCIAYKDERYEDAVFHLENAARGFEDAENPFLYRALYQQALCAIALFDYDHAYDLTTRIESNLAERNYPVLYGEVLWVKGLAEQYLRRKEQAHVSYSNALPYFKQGDDPDRLAGIHIRLAESLFELQQDPLAWDYLLEALIATDRIDNHLRLSQIYLLATFASWREGHYKLALQYADALVPFAEAAKYPLSIANAYRWRARIFAELGRLKDARADMEAARAVLSGAAETTRIQAEADLMVVESELSGDPEEAASFLENALYNLDLTENRVNQAELNVALGKAWLRAGNEKRALQPLETAVRIFESERSTLPGPYRIPYFNAVTDAYAMLADIYLNDGQDRIAFDWTERTRARRILDGLVLPGRLDARPEPLDALQASLTGDTVIVSYWASGDSWGAFVVGPGFVAYRRLDCDSKSLGNASNSLRTALTEDRADTDRISRELHGLLIDPLAGLLPLDGHIVFIPEGPLQELPWAALRGSNGSYLIERFRVTTAPSANIFIGNLSRDREAGETGDIRVIGSLSFDTAKWPDLAQLDGAKEEVEEIAGLYGSLPVFGETLSSLRENANCSRLIHFAGHALMADGADGLGGLLLLPEDGHDGLATIEDLSRLPLLGVDLVVLSACNTGIGHAQGREGMRSVANAFLAAGASGVVAGLWKVDDAGAADFMIRFHEELQRGRSAAEALRETQRAWIEDGRPPTEWAAFGAIGYARPLH